MIALFTDFGLTGPYHGQIRAVLHALAPAVPVVDLFADVPAYDRRAAAYLLRAYSAGLPADTVFLCVIDPGVGTATRQPVMVRSGAYWFVGPDNGLFHRVAGADGSRCWRITWRPERLSDSFHGRDLFAPVAARLALGHEPPGSEYPEAACLNNDWPADHAAIIYIDNYGNAMTGIHGDSVADEDRLCVGEHMLAYARTFGEASPGQPFWYRNANDLVEIAENQGHAAGRLGLAINQPVTVSGHERFTTAGGTP